MPFVGKSGVAGVRLGRRVAEDGTATVTAVAAATGNRGEGGRKSGSETSLANELRRETEMLTRMPEKDREKYQKKVLQPRATKLRTKRKEGSTLEREREKNGQVLEFSVNSGIGPTGTKS